MCMDKCHDLNDSMYKSSSRVLEIKYKDILSSNMKKNWPIFFFNPKLMTYV